jgi:hypothetical protein
MVYPKIMSHRAVHGNTGTVVFEAGLGASCLLDMAVTRRPSPDVLKCLRTVKTGRAEVDGDWRGLRDEVEMGKLSGETAGFWSDLPVTDACGIRPLPLRTAGPRSFPVPICEVALHDRAAAQDADKSAAGMD